MKSGPTFWILRINGKDTQYKCKKCLKVFKNSSVSTLKYHLGSISSTSVESERIFATRGQFVTKLRSSLSNDTFKMLLIVRSYLKNLGKKYN